MLLLKRVIEIGCILLIILCMLAPLKKDFIFKKIFSFHKTYAILLLILALIHGLLASNDSGMISGKVSWGALFILIFTAYIIDQDSLKWKNIHLILSFIFVIAVIFHIYQVFYL